MIDNPFLRPPLLESPQSKAWAAGFAFGFQGPPTSVPRPPDIEPEASDEFDDGVLVGQQAAIDGFPVLVECVDLHAELPTWVDLLPVGFDALHTLAEVATKGLVAGLGSAILAIVELCIDSTVHFDDSSKAITGQASQLADVLARMGITDSMELYLGGGIDPDIAGCELKLTPVFRSLDGARSAAQALGRPQFVVARWRTDASGSVTLADSGWKH
jgi:hypothetical protein